MKKLGNRITGHPDLCHGAPTIRGLRYPVRMILELLDSGMTADELLSDYPDLEPADIRAVLEYPADEHKR
jgi:uncharacterized protein (DUF433 family)